MYSEKELLKEISDNTSALLFEIRKLRESVAEMKANAAELLK